MHYKKSNKEKDVFSYVTSKGEKLWMYRYKYYDAVGKRKEKKKVDLKQKKKR